MSLNYFITWIFYSLVNSWTIELWLCIHDHILSDFISCYWWSVHWISHSFQVHQFPLIQGFLILIRVVSLWTVLKLIFFCFFLGLCFQVPLYLAKSLHLLLVGWGQLMSQPHFGQVWGWSPTLWKVGDLEFSGTPKCLELDNKAQNTSHWGVLGVIGKVSKSRYPKWPRIGHLDICSPSYGPKKGRESN